MRLGTGTWPGLDRTLLFSNKPWPKSTEADREASQAPPVRWTEPVILAAIVLTFAAIAIWVDAHRTLWFDEIGTMVVSTQPSLREMFLASHADGNPPLFFLLARLFLTLPIPPEVAICLPSILATGVTAIMIYVFVRRDTNSLYAFLATSAFYGSPFGLFAPLEARPYALLLCFTSIALCCWQAAVRGPHKSLATAGVALATSAAIFSHQYGVIYVGFPLLAAETVRSWRDKKFHPAVIAAMAVGAVSLVFTFPPMLRAQAGLLEAIKQCPVFFARPSLASLSLYSQMLPQFVPVVALAAAIPALLAYSLKTGKSSPGNQRLRQPSIPLEDSFAALALVLILPVMLLLTSVGTGYFWARYAVGSVLGIAILTGLLMSRVSRRLVVVDNLAIACVFYGLVFGVFGISTIRLPDQVMGAEHDPFFLSARTGEPMVIASAVVFSSTWWYSDSKLRTQIHYLSDLSYAVKNPEFVSEYSLALEQPFGAPRIDDYHEFLSTHRQFLLYCVGTPRLEWTKDRLIHEGWNLALIRSEGSKKIYRVTRTNS